MFKKTLEHIRNKPEHVRKSIAFFSSFAITGIIALFWMVSYLNYSVEVLSKSNTKDQTASVINSASEKISSRYTEIRKQFDIGSIFGSSDADSGATSTDDVQAVISEDNDSTYNMYDSNGVSSGTTYSATTTGDNKATTSAEVLVQ